MDTYTIFECEYGFGLYKDNLFVDYNDNHDEALSMLPQGIPFILKVVNAYDSELQEYVGDNSDFPTELYQALALSEGV